jgi:hypothetical protein
MDDYEQLAGRSCRRERSCHARYCHRLRRLRPMFSTGATASPVMQKNHSASALVRREIKARSFRHVISLQSRRLPCLTRARFRANQNALWQCVGRGEMTVLTGGACQLTGLPEPAIQTLPTGPGSAVRSALRTAPQRQFTTGPAATSLGSDDGFARDSPSRTGRGPSGDTRRSIPPAHR